MVRMLTDWLYRQVVQAVAARLMTDVREATGQEVEGPSLTFAESKALATPKKSSKKAGFTSVELLFVISTAGTIAACVLI